MLYNKGGAIMLYDKGIVLLSGGMDSAVCLAIARTQCQEIIALNVFYGQRHDIEIKCAKQLAEFYHADYKELDLSHTFMNFTSALLKASNIPISNTQIKNEIGATYVPARNSILLSVAAGYADTIGAKVVYYGAHAEDNGYPDCSLAYFEAMKSALFHGTHNNIILRAPFITKRKSDIVTVGTTLGVPFEKTYSCYKGEQRPCGECPTCRARLEAFRIAKCVDPLEYAQESRHYVDETK